MFCFCSMFDKEELRYNEVPKRKILLLGSSMTGKSTFVQYLLQ